MSRALLREIAAAAVIPTRGGPMGYGYVEPIDSGHYAPRADGHFAIIVPVIEYGRLIDLAACILETRRTYTRDGIASFLGWEAIDAAMINETHLQLHANPIEWLRHAGQGAVVLDWRAARYALADLPGIACSNDLLAKRVNRTLRGPLRVPPLFVKEAHLAAAA